MSDKIFVDTNLWVYLFSDDTEKKNSVQELIQENFRNIYISSQILGELFNVLIKKGITDLEQAESIVIKISEDFPVISIDKDMVKKAIKIKIRYNYSYWDSLILASAFSSKCKILYSEDLQHNQIIDEKLKISNPFIN